MKFCPQCSTLKTGQFCESCGTALIDAPAPEGSVPQQSALSENDSTLAKSELRQSEGLVSTVPESSQTGFKHHPFLGCLGLIALAISALVFFINPLFGIILFVIFAIVGVIVVESMRHPLVLVAILAIGMGWYFYNSTHQPPKDVGYDDQLTQTTALTFADYNSWSHGWFTDDPDNTAYVQRAIKHLGNKAYGRTFGNLMDWEKHYEENKSSSAQGVATSTPCEPGMARSDRNGNPHQCPSGAKSNIPSQSPHFGLSYLRAGDLDRACSGAVADEKRYNDALARGSIDATVISMWAVTGDFMGCAASDNSKYGDAASHYFLIQGQTDSALYARSTLSHQSGSLSLSQMLSQDYYNVLKWQEITGQGDSPMAAFARSKIEGLGYAVPPYWQ